MFYTGLFKRIIPFLITFAAGLFIASLFNPISFTRFPSGDRGPRRPCEGRQMKMENDQLREENLRLKAEIESPRTWSSVDDADFPPLPPVPEFDGDTNVKPHPAPPRAPRHR